MGRAIDMEKDIDMLKIEMKRLDNIVRGMLNELDEVAEEVELMAEESTKTKEKKDGNKKADTKGNEKSNKSSDKASGDAGSKGK